MSAGAHFSNDVPRPDAARPLSGEQRVEADVMSGIYGP